jgi:hypothetical protein
MAPDAPHRQRRFRSGRPPDTCALAYATDGYDQSSRNMARTSLESDNVFGDDGGVDQLATVTGSVRDGFVASLTVPV